MIGLVYIDPALVGWLAVVLLSCVALAAYRMYLSHIERMQARADHVVYEQREQDRLNLELKKAAFEVAIKYADLYTKLWNEGRWDRDTAPPFRVIFNPRDWATPHETPDVTLADSRE